MSKLHIKRVVMWRRNLLPGSETFIRSQLDGLVVWQGVALGATKVVSPVAASKDRVLYGGQFSESLFLRLFSWTGWSLRLYKELKLLRPALVHAHFAMDGILIAGLCRLL